MLALTATATQETLQVASERLALKDVVVVALPPSRPNIMYKVQPLQNLEEFSISLSTGLRRLGAAFPKTVIFCQKYTDCSQLYLTIRRLLGVAFTHPSGYPDFHQFRLVELFTRVSTVPMREMILNSFTKPNSTLRLLIATTSFGMGVDCQDIRTVIHWGATTKRCLRHVNVVTFPYYIIIVIILFVHIIAIIAFSIICPTLTINTLDQYIINLSTQVITCLQKGKLLLRQLTPIPCMHHTLINIL